MPKNVARTRQRPTTGGVNETLPPGETSHACRKTRKVRALNEQGEVVTILYRRDLERLREQYGRSAA